MTGRPGVSVYAVSILTVPWSHAVAAGVAHLWQDLRFTPDWFCLVPIGYTERPVGAFPSWALGRQVPNRDGDTCYVWMVDGKAQRAAQSAEVAA